MSGLDLAEFMKYDERPKAAGGGSGDWLPNWRGDSKLAPKQRRGSIVVWMHTKARIYPSFTHNFVVEDEKDDNGKKTPFLKFPRFVSPDGVDVHENQHFREDGGMLRVKPIRDPFLLLREWLRVQGQRGRLGLDTPVFEWMDPKTRSPLIWHLGHLSRLEERNQVTFGHSLDTKEEILFTVVAHPTQVVDGKDTGVPLASGGSLAIRLARESKTLGSAMSKLIKQQSEAMGDSGNPYKQPYPFRWDFDGSKAFAACYTVTPLLQVEATDDIWKLIVETDPLEAAKHCTFQESDLVKMRDAMEKAQQIDLPLDLIFSTEVKDRMAALEGAGFKGAGATSSHSAPPTRQPSAQPGAARPSTQPSSAAGGAPVRRAVGGATPPPQSPQAEAAASQGGRMRRRVADATPPPPPPPPAEEMLPCEACHKPMKASADTCPHCQTKYEILNDDAPVAGAKASGGEVQPSQVVGAQDCWSCRQQNVVVDGKCTNCNLDHGEDIPF